jgi:transcriptional regulator with XRE-family HTH domain/predicted transcriptional regulator
MPSPSEQLRLVLGVKLKTLRQERGLTLDAAARRAGVSISYLSEIEKGKKYPKPEKLVVLAAALGVSYDDLVSLRVEEPLEQLRSVITSPFLRAFPFDLFGVGRQDVVALMAGVPERAGAMIRAFLEVGRTYDARVEHFLFAALRAYQQMHGNHFPELEAAADDFRRTRGWDARAVPVAHVLRHLLEADHGYRVETRTLRAHPVLGDLRSVYVAGARPTLYVNGALRDEQLGFLYARELGFLTLRPEERPATSSWLQVTSFEQVLANFRASYFAGALLLPSAALDADLRSLFAQPGWNARAFVRALARYRATTEMLFYRLTERLPAAFGLSEVFFLRFHRHAGEDHYRLTKALNMSRVPVPHGVDPGEHYCRRWAAMAALRELAAEDPADGGPVVAAQRAYFVGERAEFFTLAAARALALQPGAHTAVMLGVLVDRAARRVVRFLEDPALPRVEVNLTCERCGIPDCAVRAAAPTALHTAEALAQREEALAALVAQTRGGPEN